MRHVREERDLISPKTPGSIVTSRTSLSTCTTLSSREATGVAVAHAPTRGSGHQRAPTVEPLRRPASHQSATAVPHPRKARCRRCR